MNKKRYMIGFDVGGTKTEAVLFDETGNVLSHTVGPGGVPIDVGVETAKVHYLDVLRRLTEGFDGRIESVYGSIATVEYFDNTMLNYLTDNFPAGKIRLEGDGCCMISGMLGHRDGCSIVCGTGSSVYIREGDSYRTIGGRGYLIDSCGSGFVLGKFALQSAFRALDGRGQKTILIDLISKQCGEFMENHYVSFHQGGRSYIASFAGTVFEARRLGDPVAVKIFNHGVKELADCVWAAYRQLGKPFDLVYNGGIFLNHPEYAEAIKMLSPEAVNSIFSDVKPVYGCAVEAMHDIGLDCGADFKANYLATIQ